MPLKARFTMLYNLVVLTVSLGLCLWVYLLLRHSAATEGAISITVMALLMAGVFATQLVEIFRRSDVLIVTPQGIHDRRLTRGPLLWSQIDRIIVYRKGWQYVARIEPKSMTTQSHAMGLGPMPLYAFNRYCARLLKRPELVVGLGGMTVSHNDLLAYAQQYFKGDWRVEA